MEVGKSKAYPAATIMTEAGSTPVSLVDAVQFQGVRGTKRDALIKEVGGLYASCTLDELVRNSHFACQHMQEMGLFNECRARIDTAPSTANSYKVTFFVKELPQFNCQAGMNVTATEEADFTVRVQKMNLNGRGESITVSGSSTLKGLKFDFTAVKPFLGWRKYSNIGLSCNHGYRSMQWNKSDVTETALILHYAGPLISDKLKYQLRLNMVGEVPIRELTWLIWRQFQPSAQVAFPIREHAGHTSKISVENIWTLADTRDRLLLPSSGGLVRISQELAGLFGDASFVKHELDVQAAAPLLYGMFIGASLKAVAINALTDRTLHLLDRFYLGGPYDIRGFDLNSIGTRINGCSMGGTVGYAAALHAYLPLVPHDMLFAHGFITCGSLASVRSRNWYRDLSEAPRISAGLGLAFIFNNMLRFELNYVLPLKHVPGDACPVGGGFQLGAGVFL